MRSFVAATQKLGSDLQISKEEAKKFSAGARRRRWRDTCSSCGVLGRRIDCTDEKLRVGRNVRATALRSCRAIYSGERRSKRIVARAGKIRNQFSGLLGATGIGRGAGSLKPELYWELLDADDQGVITLGASYSRSGAGGTYQAADVLYYASGGYYVALTLYQMWPVTVEGKPSTLVWRGDMISAASLGTLHGVERLGSESVMMKNITKAVTLFRRDTGGGR